MIPFQAALDEHGPGLYRHLVGTLGPHDGADCYQETVIAALRAWPPAHDGNVRGWFFTIAHRKAIDAGRARGRRPVPVERLPEPARAMAPVGPDLDGDVWAAVRTLPEKQKAMMNGQLVGEGSVVADFRVVKIEPRKVIVERDGIKLAIEMK